MFIAVEWKLSLFGLRGILPDAFCESFFRETDEQRHSGIDLKVDTKELYTPEGFLNFETFSSPVVLFLLSVSFNPRDSWEETKRRMKRTSDARLATVSFGRSRIDRLISSSDRAQHSR